MSTFIWLTLCVASAFATLQLSETDSRVVFGPSNAITNLYRNGSSTLRTDGNLIVGGNLTVLGSSEVAVSVNLAQLVSSLIFQPTTIHVGVGRQFSSLQAAYQWILTKAVMAPLTVQIHPGTYNVSQRLIFQAMPSPQLITIQGNISNPASVVLKCAGAACSSAGFLVFLQGTNDLTFQGVTLLNSATGGSAIAVALGHDTLLFYYVHIQSFPSAISVGSHGAMNTYQLTVTGCSGDCVTVSFDGYVDLYGAKITGTGGTSRGLVVIGGWVNAEYVAFTALNYGFICYSSIMAYVQTGGGTATYYEVTTPISCSNYN